MKIVLTAVTEIWPDMLYPRERVSPGAIVEALPTEVARRTVKRLVAPRLSLAQREAFYEHGVDWTDRLIVGDSRIVMDSVLESDLLTGKVEMIYIDPPPSDGTDDDPTDEAESSLAYLRDRLSLCRDLLHESGSVFVRVSDASLPGVRRVMDEVLGADNHCGIVTLPKGPAPPGELLSAFGDYPVRSNGSAGDSLIWYGRDVARVTYQQLLVVLRFQAQYPTVFGEGKERRRRCGVLLR